MYPADLKYTKDHEWIRVSGTQGRVGITDYAQKQLGDVVYVELPEVGRTVSQGEALGTIESVKAVSEMFAPVSGEVVEVNPALKDNPETLNSDPHGAWMVAQGRGSGETALLDALHTTALVKYQARHGTDPASMPATAFAARHIGPRQSDLADMLQTIGASSLDQLVAETVPAAIRLTRPLDLPRRRERAPLSRASSRDCRRESRPSIVHRARLLRHDYAGRRSCET